MERTCFCDYRWDTCSECQFTEEECRVLKEECCNNYCDECDWCTDSWYCEEDEEEEEE